MKKIALVVLTAIAVAGCAKPKPSTGPSSPASTSPKIDLTALRDKFKEGLTAQLKTLDTQIEQLDAKAKTATGDAKQDLENTVADLRARRKKLDARLEKTGDTAADKWKAFSDEIAKDVEGLQAAAKGALDKVTSATPKVDREKFKTTTNTSLTALDAQIKALKAMAKDAKGEVKTNLDKAVNDLEAARKKTAEKLDKGKDVGDDKWEGFTKEINEEIQQLQEAAKTALDKAKEAPKPMADRKKFTDDANAALKGIDADIQKVEAEAKKAKGEAKTKLDKAVKDLKDARKKVADNLAKAKDVTEDKWEAYAKEVNKEVQDLQMKAKEALEEK